MAKSLQKIQNLALKKILGVFRTAPFLPMEVESALAPPRIRPCRNTRQYTFRLNKLSKFYPVNMEANAEHDLPKLT